MRLLVASFALLLAGCCCGSSSSSGDSGGNSKRTSPDEGKRDSLAEIAIMNDYRKPLYKGDPQPELVRGVVAKRTADGSLDVSVSTSLYPKKENESRGVGICGSINGLTFAGRKVTRVWVKSSDTTMLATTRNSLCRGRSDPW